MKKLLLFVSLSVLAFFISDIQVIAQHNGDDKVTVQITKDGKVVTDTVFQLKEDQDPDAVKKTIARILEGDIDEEKVMVFKGEENESQHKVIIRKGSEGEETIIISGDHLEISEEDADPGVIIIEEKKERECEGPQKHVKVYVEGDDDMEILEDEDFEWIEENVENEENVEIYVIKKDDGTKVVKKIKVVVEEDDEDHEHGIDQMPEPPQKEPPKAERKKK